jgi:hypothetical protein
VSWCRSNSSGSGQDPATSSCEHSNEPLSYINAEEFLG